MERLKALSLNIWNRQGPWEQRLAVIRAGIEALAPDIVGLQEVLRLEAEASSPRSPGDARREAPKGSSQADEIAAGLGLHVSYASAWEIGGGLHFGNAILSRFPVIEEGVALLPQPRRDQTRAVGYALLDAPCGRIPAFVTHLAWKLHEADVRLAQVRALDDFVRAHAPIDGFPPILMGDMNAEPDSDEMRFLRGLTALGGRGTYYADCWAVCGSGPGHTYSRDNPYALRSREPSRRIDYVLSRGPDRQLRGEPLSARVVFDQPVGGVWASDHYGVYAEIQAAARPHDPY